ncbi:MAG: DinB family protein [Deltaproteobacteria bacterium]|nr:DinB family protein [Deltaproteobacteria bacterium]
MEINEIITLFDYNCWAIEKVIKSTSNLSANQFTAQTPCSHGSLRGTIVHILSAEWIWRLRCQEGISPDQFIDEKHFLTPESLGLRLIDEQSKMRKFLSTLDNSDLQSSIEYKTTKGAVYKNTLWHLIMHLFNHGTHHRSEVAEMLSRYGHSPGGIDFIIFLRDLKSNT